MSFLLLRGKAYHCRDSGKFVKVEYQGGERETQVGDMNVFEQRSLNREYNEAGYDPEKRGYYFYFEGLICQDCFDKNYRKPDNINVLRKDNPVDKSYSLIMNRDKLLRKLMKDILNSHVNDISIGDLKTINDDSYSKNILSDDFEVTFQIKELLNNFFSESKKEIKEYFNR